MISPSALAVIPLMIRGESVNTMKITITHHTREIRIVSAIPFLILPYSSAPRFCPQYVDNAEPREKNGVRNKEVAFLAAVCATIMFVPKVLIQVCRARDPSVTKEIINPMESPVGKSCL